VKINIENQKRGMVIKNNGIRKSEKGRRQYRGQARKAWQKQKRKSVTSNIGSIAKENNRGVRRIKWQAGIIT